MAGATSWATLARAALLSRSIHLSRKSFSSQLGSCCFQRHSVFRYRSRCMLSLRFVSPTFVVPERPRPPGFHTCSSCDFEAHSSVGSGNIDMGTSKNFDIDSDWADQSETESSVNEDEDEYLAHFKGQLQSGLYLVATPIGNLEDITLRAIRVLKSADLILTEDTRHSAKLLQHYDINTPTVSYHKFNETRRMRFCLERLQHGGALALISDAGMPGISDPGAELVMSCVNAKIHVFPIPGPCAVVTALVAAGLPTNEFSFVGFLSTQESHRRKRLMVASSENATQVIYVPPHKLCRVLKDCMATFGNSRRCVVAREMTKIHEEFWRGTLEEADAEFSIRNPRGEITLVIEGLHQTDVKGPTDEELHFELETALANGISISEAAKLVAQKMSAKKKRVYELALRLSGQGQ